MKYKITVSFDSQVYIGRRFISLNFESPVTKNKLSRHYFKEEDETTMQFLTRMAEKIKDLKWVKEEIIKRIEDDKKVNEHLFIEQDVVDEIVNTKFDIEIDFK